MPDPGLSTLLIPLAVIGTLLAVLVFVRRQQRGAQTDGAKSAGPGRRLRIVEMRALGPRERLALVSVDNREFLLVATRDAVALTAIGAEA